MRSSLRIVRILGFASAVWAAGCLHEAPTGSSGVLTLDRLVGELRQQGVNVSSRGTEPHESFSFFSVQAKQLTINGDDVHVFEYATEMIATSEASTVAAAGTPIGTTQVTWISPPRFYKRDRFILLYVGTTIEVVRALDAVFGEPFAGGTAGVAPGNSLVRTGHTRYN